MSKKVVAVIGALDRKGAVCKFLKECIEANGVSAVIIDIGLSAPEYSPDVSAEALAEAGGGILTELLKAGDVNPVIDAMCNGAGITLRKLHDEGKIDGAIAIGGDWGRVVGAAAMSALPIGVPKLMLTAPYGDAAWHEADTDILTMPSVIDIEGINRLSAKMLANAAGAITGMVNASQIKADSEKPIVAVTLFGTTVTGAKNAMQIAADNGCEVMVFYAGGAGGKIMEALIRDGYIDGVLDITTTELADELFGGVFSAGAGRLTAAGEAGIPQVVSSGALDMVKLGPKDSVDDEFKGRLLLEHGAQNTLMRTNAEENIRLAEIIADKLNNAKGKAAFVLPKNGFSSMGVDGGLFRDADADKAFCDTLKQRLNDNVQFVELDVDVNDEELASVAVNILMDGLAEG